MALAGDRARGRPGRPGHHLALAVDSGDRCHDRAGRRVVAVRRDADPARRPAGHRPALARPGRSGPPPPGGHARPGRPGDDGRGRGGHRRGGGLRPGPAARVGRAERPAAAGGRRAAGDRGLTGDPGRRVHSAGRSPQPAVRPGRLIRLEPHPPVREPRLASYIVAPASSLPGLPTRPARSRGCPGNRSRRLGSARLGHRARAGPAGRLHRRQARPADGRGPGRHPEPGRRQAAPPAGRGQPRHQRRRHRRPASASSTGLSGPAGSWCWSTRSARNPGSTR